MSRSKLLQKNDLARLGKLFLMHLQIDHNDYQKIIFKDLGNYKYFIISQITYCDL